MGAQITGLEQKIREQCSFIDEIDSERVKLTAILEGKETELERQRKQIDSLNKEIDEHKAKYEQIVAEKSILLKNLEE